MVYLAYALVIFTAVYFNKTKSGLNYKAVGEYPKAAATLGINVVATKYVASVICGALAGMGGAYLTTCYTTTYVDGNVAGRGLHRPGGGDLRPVERWRGCSWPACSSASATRCRSASRWAPTVCPTSSSR